MDTAHDDDDRAAAREDVLREQDLVEEEASALAELVARVVRSDGAEAPAVHERFRQILSKYQEEPQLLDGHLEALVSPLARLLRRRAALAAERQPAPPPGAGAVLPPLCPSDAAAALDVGRLLGAVVSVRGAKAVARFLTHEAADLEVALGLLLRLEAAEKAAAEAALAGGEDGGADSAAMTTTTWSPAEGAAARSWPWQEAQAVVLLWLSLLALAPFDLAVLDSSLDAGGGGTGGGNGVCGSTASPPPLARRLASACAARLHETGAAREMAALALARLLTRPDMGALLAEFFAWARGALERAAAAAAMEAGQTAAPTTAPPTAGAALGGGEAAPSTLLLAWPPFPTEGVAPAQAAARATFLAPGVLRALGLVFKLGPRSVCAPLAARAWQLLEELQEQQAQTGAGQRAPLLSGSPLARRLVAKLAQRAALALLPPPPPPPPESGGEAAEDLAAPPEDHHPFELHEAVEGVVGWLLDSALSDRDTVVRWSGAKGVARVAAALPSPQLTDEVAGSVLSTLFVEGGSDAAWHGGCLALAELARRGCLPAARLGEAAPLLARALAFDAPARGGCAAHSVGAHVRDAGAYACWALARAFGSGGGSGGGGGGASSSASAAVERVFLDSLAPALLSAACYDREVNCRRAAAAAFQEAVGRLGGNCLAHGLEALHAAQYSTVGQAQSAALRAAPQIAALGSKGGYRPALVEALVERQLRHWDGKGTRALAARALAALVPALAMVVRGDDEGESEGDNNDDGIALLTGEGGAVATLLARVGPEATLEERTGALMALGEVLPALAAAHARCSAAAAGASSSSNRLFLRPADAAAAASLLPHVAACGLYRGRGGEATREAAARLLEGVSRAQEKGAAGGGGRRHHHHHHQRWSLPLDAAHHAAARLLLDDCTRHPSERVHRAGEGALRAYAASLVGAAARRTRRTSGAAEGEADAADATDAAAAAALPALEALVDRTWPERLLADALPIHRRGAAGALGALPAALVAGAALPPLVGEQEEGLAERRRSRPEALLRALAAAALEGAQPDRFELPVEAGRLQAAGAVALPACPLAAECRDAEARAEAAAALGRVCGELWGGGVGGGDRALKSGRGLEEEQEEEGDGNDDAVAAAADANDDGPASPPSSPPSSATTTPDRALLPQIVLPALLAACRDCTTDSRGDAGAWVREAAVGALGRALPPALALAAAAEADDADADTNANAATLCRDAVGALLQQSLGRIARLRHAALRELRALLPPLAVEEEAEAATASASASAAPYRVLPGAAAVSRAVHAERDLDEAGIASLRAFCAVAELLLVDDRAAASCYRCPWLLEGVVAAAGGVDASLARAAGRVLARAVASKRGGAAGEVAKGLVRLWARVQKDGKDFAPGERDDAAGSGAAAHARLATPLARAALLALRKGGSDVAWLPVVTADGAAVPFASAVVELLRAEVRGCTDIPRLAEAATLAAELIDRATRAAAAVGGGAPPLPLDRLLALRADAARLLLVLLGNRYPRVRRAAAEAAYVAVLGMRADAAGVVCSAAGAPAGASGVVAAPASLLPDARALDEAAALLLEGQAWDGADLGAARAARDALAALLGVEAPKAVVAPGVVASAPPDAAPSKATTQAAAAAAAAALLLRATAGGAGNKAGCRFDENASYQSLLDDAARGGGY